MEHNNQAFEYTYSAPQQEEIRRIREKYLPKEENKLEQLRRLDKQVTAKGTKRAIAVGIIGALVMGTGMSCCMVGPEPLMLPGIIVGILGMVLVGTAYPLYARITKKERERIAPEILRLTEELME